MSEIQVGPFKVGLQHPPFVVAEMSGNHNQSLERALEIVDAAASSGAHAVKLQTYTADTLTLDVKTEQFMLRDENSPWKDSSLYDLFKAAYTPWEWHEPIFRRAKERGLACFSTPFDETAVEFLEGLDVPAYKIASFELTHLPLIRAVASTGKPLLMSTGMATLEEIEEAMAVARAAGCKQLCLLKCTSAYPAKVTAANVLTIPDMRRRFGCEVGLSDHTMGSGVAAAAVAHGATLIEKHFTVRRSDGGVDSAFSIEPEEMKSLVIETEVVWQSLGQVRYGATDEELPSLQERRSLYISADCKAGDVLTKENVRCIRPSYGLAPKHYDAILGKRLKRNVKKGTPLSWDLIAD